VADAIATVEWEVWDGDKMVEGKHPLKVLWDRPNPAQSNSEFLRAAIGFLLLSGNGYIEAAEGNRGRPTELYALRSDRMKVVPNSEGQVASFIYTYNSRNVRWEVDPITGRGPIKHMKMFNPLDDFYGMSPIEAGAFALDQHNESMKWMQALIQNSAKPSGALVMKEGLTMGDEQFSRLQATIEANHSGAANAGRPMLLENGLEWQQMGLSPTDMGILETKYSAARDVALAFGVPSQLLGIPGDATYSNYKEARLAFYEDTVLPLLSHLLGALNPWFEEPFNGAKIVPNLDSIPAIADKRQEKWDMVDKSRELTLNERREAKGYPPIETVVPGENGNRLLNLDRAEAGVNTPDGKALLARLAYGS
jgi:HK97 family phage portal protein